MDEESRNSRRKSKHMPRQCIEDFELTHMNKQDSNQESSVQNLLRLRAEIDKDDQPVEVPPPIQFSVNVEVEECEEDFSIDNAKACTSNDSHINNSCLTEYYTPPIKTKTKPVLQQCIINETKLRKETEKMFKRTTYIADKLLEIEIRNSWGKNIWPDPDSGQENQVQSALDKWRIWVNMSKTRDSIFTYKCYVCNIGWWYLMPFRDHLKDHEDVDVTIESSHNECNLIIIDNTVELVTKEVPIEGFCGQCVKDSKTHTALKGRYDSIYYYCDGCNDRFSSCAPLAFHEGICQKYLKKFFIVRCDGDFKCELCYVKCITQDRYDFHMIEKHSVRSDIPVTMSLKSCTVCSGKYVVHSLHECPLKPYNFECYYCPRKFQNKHCAVLHERLTKNDHNCPVCHKMLRKQCMEMEHMVRHSVNYALAYKCNICKDTILFPNEASSKTHLTTWHGKRVDKKRRCFDLMVVPKNCLKYTSINKYYVLDGTLHKFMKPNSKSSEQPELTPIASKSSISKPLITNEPTYETLDTEDDVGDVDDEAILETKRQIEEAEKEIEQSKKYLNSLLQKRSNRERNENEDSKSLEETVIKSEVLDIKEEIIDYEYNDVAPDELTSTEIPAIEMPHVELPQEEMPRHVELPQVEMPRHVELPQVAMPALRFIALLPVVSKTLVTDHEMTVIAAPDIVIKEEIDDLEFDEIEAGTVEEDGPIHQAQVKEELEDCDETIRRVFTASQSIIGTDVSEKFANYQQGYSIKEEPIDEEDYEDDIIVLNYDLSRNSEANTETAQKEPSSEDMTSFEPEITISLTAAKEKKVYKCVRCEYKGHHKEFRHHIKTVCLRTPKIKTVQPKTVVHIPKQPWTLFPCSKCSINYVNLERYLQHLPWHNLPSMSCPGCHMKIDEYPKFLAHVTSHIKNSFVKIRVIEAGSSGKCSGTLKRSRVYQCNRCEERVSLDNQFVHWEGHLGLNVLKKETQDTPDGEDEDDCGKSPLAPDMLKKALLQLKTPREVRVKQCVVCTREFSRRNDCQRHLVEHLLQDAGADRWRHEALRCQLCHALHDKVDKYKAHMRAHASLPLYKCEICNKTFSDSSNFTKHKKVHNLKVLVCDLCKKKFQAKTSLEKHMELHRVTKPTSCKQCDRIFYSQSQYIKHVRVIHDKIPIKFSCMICKKKFVSLKYKWDHMWEVHKERKFKADCPFCNKSFRKYSDVKVHVRETHKVQLVKKIDDSVYVYK